MTSDDDPQPDYGLVAPLSIPADSLVPDPDTGASTSAEYDLYFRIVRDNPGLLPWTRTCLRVNGELLEDLQHTGLPVEDKYQILHGLLAVQRVTLERWVAAGDDATEPAGKDGAAGEAKKGEKSEKSGKSGKGAEGGEKGGTEPAEAAGDGFSGPAGNEGGR